MRTGLLAHSEPMRAVLEQVARYAAADANVLISGETGVGKDAVARALHLAGPRRDEPFVKVDCPSLPSTLIEAELFGHERGAFTDATVARPGRFEVAGGGTVYLDNVNELPLEVQGKLLRVVEDKRVERVGGVAPIAIRARIVASADDRIEEAVAKGLFRDDLYHRLRVLPLRIPPLRERVADIVPLARAFLAEAGRRLGVGPLALASDAAAILTAYPWPGNVRQLRHLIERAVVSLPAGATRIEGRHLPPELLEDTAVLFGPASRRPTLGEVERRYIELVLRETRGNQTRAAQLLGISRKALWAKRRRYGLA
jgi:DNA-binding NtrC family response regulator